MTVLEAAEPLEFRRQKRDRMRREFLHRLRIQESDARGVDGRDVRRRFPEVRVGVREARGRSLWAAARERLTGGFGPRAISINIFKASMTD